MPKGDRGTSLEDSVGRPPKAMCLDIGRRGSNKNGSYMAQRTQVILEDDIDGGPADETVTFALQGAQYEIDLNVKNALKLIKALEPFTTAARKTGGRRSGSGSARTTGGAATRGGADKAQLSQMRDWGKANGYKVSDRGRVSADLQEAYHKAI